MLKKKYPQLIYIINDVGRYPETEPEGYDLFDEHFYVTPERFPAMAHRYDVYPRDGKKIYVGEYAANQEAGIGNMAAACSEASFMINMERNGDVVRMASYAPLCVICMTAAGLSILFAMRTTRYSAFRLITCKSCSARCVRAIL